MHASSLMRTVVVLSTLFSSLQLVSAGPINILEIHPDGSMVERSVDERDASWMRHNGTYHSSEERSFESDDEDMEKRGVTRSGQSYSGKNGKKPPAQNRPSRKVPSKNPGATTSAGQYVLDCTAYPEICSNICYYQYCKHGSLIQHPQKGRKEAAECSSRPNKCSTGHKGAAGAYPHAGYQCDEFPLASTKEGGNSNAATRCVPGRQNGGAGGRFKFPAGTSVTTVLQNTGSAPHYCDKKCDRSKDKDGRQS